MQEVVDVQEYAEIQEYKVESKSEISQEVLLLYVVQQIMQHHTEIGNTDPQEKVVCIKTVYLEPKQIQEHKTFNDEIPNSERVISYQEYEYEEVYEPEPQKIVPIVQDPIRQPICYPHAHRGRTHHHGTREAEPNKVLNALQGRYANKAKGLVQEQLHYEKHEQTSEPSLQECSEILQASPDPQDPEKEKEDAQQEIKEKTEKAFLQIQSQDQEFFRAGYKLWNKIKLTTLSPAFQVLADELGITKEEFEIYIRHIFEPAINITKDNLYRIQGFHYDINNILEKTGGLFRFVNKEMFAHGYYKAQLEVMGRYEGKMINKSFFPAHWAPERVMQEIFIAMENMILISDNNLGEWEVVKDIAVFLNSLPSHMSTLRFLGYATDNAPIAIIFNIKNFSFISVYPWL